MCWVEVDGKEIPWEEYDKIQQARKQEEYRELREQMQELQKLVGVLGSAFTAVSVFLEDHPKLKLKIDLRIPTAESVDQQDTQVYELLKQRLGLADEAPRCMHVKADGIRCGSPRMKNGELCFAHQRMAQAQSLQQRLGNIEDANGIQMAISEVTRSLDADKITARKAGLLLYGLQTAMANAKHVTFHKSPKEMVTEETPVSAREAKSDEPRINANSRELETEQTRASQPGYLSSEPVGMSVDERYRFENVDPDLQLEFNEWCAKVFRRWIEKQKALTNGNGHAEEAAA